MGFWNNLLNPNNAPRRAHTIRDENGVMIGKFSPRVLNQMLDEYPNAFKPIANGAKYQYTGYGFSVGNPEICKIMIWNNATIDAIASDEM